MGLEHSAGATGWIRFRFAASEPFEVEDQRQWLDASFKTYFRPLSTTPLPYDVSAGSRIQQSVIISLSERSAATASPARRRRSEPVPWAPRVGEDTSYQAHVHVYPTADAVAGGPRLPSIGVAAPDLEAIKYAGNSGAATLLDRLQHVWCRFDLGEPDEGRLVAQAACYAELAERHRVTAMIEAVFPCRDSASAESERLARILGNGGLNASHVAIVPSCHVSNSATTDYPLATEAAGPPSYAAATFSSRFDYAPLDRLIVEARTALPNWVRVGSGSATSFTELNRRRPPGAAEFVCYATNAVVHDAADLAVMQTLDSLAPVARTAREIWSVTLYYARTPDAREWSALLFNTTSLTGHMIVLRNPVRQLGADVSPQNAKSTSVLTTIPSLGQKPSWFLGHLALRKGQESLGASPVLGAAEWPCRLTTPELEDCLGLRTLPGTV